MGSWFIQPSVIPGLALHRRAVALLDDGDVFMAGGSDYGPPSVYEDLSQKYDPDLDSYTTLATLPTGRYNARAERLPSGDILVFGGYDGSSYLNDALIYDVSLDSYSSAPNNMPYAAQSHTSVVLDNGDVMTFGGSNGGGDLNSTASYNEGTGVWTSKANLPQPLMYLSATKLDDGTVFIVGGRNSGVYSSSAYIYDPDLDSYSTVASAPIAMRGGFIETLDSGDVVYGGGEQEGQIYSYRAYYYDVTGDTWTSAEILPDHRAFADSVKLDDGTILVFGGNIDPNGQIKTVLRRSN